MTLATSLLLAFRALRRNPTRAFLTTLGIVIGIAAVITMMEVGNGASQSIRESIEGLGASSIMVLPGSSSHGGVRSGFGGSMTLTPDDYLAIERECSLVRRAAPQVTVREQIIWENTNYRPSQIIGTTPSFLDIRNQHVDEGVSFSESDVDVGAPVCVIGRTVAAELFGSDDNVLGREVRIRNTIFTVVGLLEQKGSNMMGQDQDDVVIAPWTTLRQRVAGQRLITATSSSQGNSVSTSTVYPGSGTADFYPEQSASALMTSLVVPRFVSVDNIMVEALSPEMIPETIIQVENLLRERHEIPPGGFDDFRIMNFSEMLNTLTATTELTRNLLLCVALISLVVGGVGIMNIMLVSVTERTREIGLRMAVGAKAGDILMQFLVEATVLCLSGGLIGILCGRGGSMLIGEILKWPIASSPSAIAAAVLVSAGVGIIFGFYPAWKASRLDPIEALRYE